MKFVALVSGGKDSCYNILHCLKQGHELVAFANLFPQNDQIQELNSFMFQTVGHDLVSQYDKCCGIPLVRRKIDEEGSKNVDLNYMQTAKDDEIEVMFQLLNDVKTRFPEVEAVSVGAILSSYQRTRVENVCNRLGLTVLSYLWQRDQLELMQEMCSMSKTKDSKEQNGHLDARLIKVAAIGLNETHLNKSLPEILPTMMNLNSKYEVNICGEGGEFETMVVDAPFFKNGYLDIVNVEKDSNNQHDGVYNAKLNIEFKERGLPDNFLSKELERLPEPSLLDSKWTDLLQSVNIHGNNIDSIKNTRDGKANSYQPIVAISQVQNTLYISNLTANYNEYATIEDQTHNIFDQLDRILEERKLIPSQIIYSSLILSDMANFSKINAIYNSWFDTSRWGPLPPSRACVASNKLGKAHMIQLSVVMDITPNTIVNFPQNNISLNQNKDGLHVQGRSYWAPCNIGPYSQAIWLKNDYQSKICRISGQIALDPKSMSLVSNEDLALQSVLSLRHFDTLKNTIDAACQLFMTCFVSSNDMIPVVSRTWSLYCSEMSYESELWMHKKDDPIQSLIIVKVSELPREALCEWGGVTCKELQVNASDDEFSDDDDVATNTLMQRIQQLDIKQQSNISVSNGNKTANYTTGFADTSGEIIQLLSCTDGYLTIYYNPDVIEETFQEIVTADCHRNYELYPVQAVFDHAGKEHIIGYHYIY